MLVGITVGWSDSIIKTAWPWHSSFFLLQSLHLLLGCRSLASTSLHNPWTDPSSRVSLSLWSLFLFFLIKNTNKRLFMCGAGIAVSVWKADRVWKALSHILLGSAEQWQQHCRAPATDKQPLDVWSWCWKQPRETKDWQRTNSSVTDWWFYSQQHCTLLTPFQYG